MSSNIRVERVCHFCATVFTARTTVTKFCSHNCARRWNKEKQRAGKLEKSHAETLKLKYKPIEELNVKEFLTVKEVARLLNCSVRSAYNCIRAGQLKGVNLRMRITRVKRSEIDKLFEQPLPAPAPEERQFEISECYSTEQVREKFGISESGLRNIILKHNIPKFKKGWYAYVPKTIIERILK